MVDSTGPQPGLKKLKHAFYSTVAESRKTGETERKTLFFQGGKGKDYLQKPAGQYAEHKYILFKIAGKKYHAHDKRYVKKGRVYRRNKKLL